MSAFQPYDPKGPIDQTWRNLPHRQQAGATYFVTFRLADALPQSALQRLDELRQLNAGEAFAWIDRFLDLGTGACLLATSSCLRITEAALQHFDTIRYALGAYAVMPNHVHVLVQPFAPFSLTQVVHGWKSYTAHQIQQCSTVRGRIWQEESFDRIVRDATELHRFTEYIAANPAAAGLSPGSFASGKGSARWTVETA